MKQLSRLKQDKILNDLFFIFLKYDIIKSRRVKKWTLLILVNLLLIMESPS